MARSRQTPPSLNLKSPDVYHAAARLAKLKGTSMTQAVLEALQADLRRHSQRKQAVNEIERMEAFSKRIGAMPLLDTRTEDEILGYAPGGYFDGH